MRGFTRSRTRVVWFRGRGVFCLGRARKCRKLNPATLWLLKSGGYISEKLAVFARAVRKIWKDAKDTGKRYKAEPGGGKTTATTGATTAAPGKCVRVCAGCVCTWSGP